VIIYTIILEQKRRADEPFFVECSKPCSMEVFEGTIQPSHVSSPSAQNVRNVVVCILSTV
jgi:hypothetical protein